LIHRHPPGLAAPAGPCYAHAVLSEDLIVNGALAGTRPLAFTTWAGRTGLSDLPDLPVGSTTGLAMPVSRPLAEHASWRAWSRRVQVDLPRLRQYAQAVYAATDAYLATLSDTALDPARRELPGCLLNALLLTLATRRGEIAGLLAVVGQPAATDDTPSAESADTRAAPGTAPPDTRTAPSTAPPDTRTEPRTAPPDTHTAHRAV
jgi:hypothetical protein